MESAFCPLCNVLQSPRHLFWDCTAATTLWSRIRDIWEQLTAVTYPGPNAWGSFISSMILSQRVLTESCDRERWRILFSEAVWSIWKHRCEWSFHETETFSINAILNLFVSRMRTRIEICRQATRDEAGLTDWGFKKMWGFSPETSNFPPWL